MTQSDLGKEDYRHASGTYGEAFCQFNKGNHCATMLELYRTGVGGKNAEERLQYALQSILSGT